MQIWRAVIIARIAIGLIMAVALSLAPPLNIVAHNPAVLAQAEIERHVALVEADNHHGHVHEDGDDQEQRSGHLHGHNAADHSHDTASRIADDGTPCSVSIVRQLVVTLQSNVDPDFSFRLERPPRSLMQA